jgi:alginate O-acetyltransferase complex protein AlgI
MVFSSSVFLLLCLPILLCIYYLADKKYRNLVLLFFSIFFYAWGAPQFVLTLLGLTFCDYYLVMYMDKMDDPNKKKWLLAISICLNVSFLIYFKYCNFFIENMNHALLGIGINTIESLSIIMPIGISFYTFETLTYSIDIYRKIHKPLPNVKDYFLYIFLFPKLIAGPIIRFNTLADQILSRNETYQDRIYGFCRFCLGLGKKVLIANVLGKYCDANLTGDFEHLNSTTAWVSIFAYTFQLYFDFSGYSDMALGLGRMFGFRFTENFDNPYYSKSITEFWRRWHITLGSWMRDYLYIPLGGNRTGSNFTTYLNLWIVFLISGLWHGASWNFVIWGAYHGFFLIVERWKLLGILKKMGTIASSFYAIFIVVMGWVIFRIENLSHCLTFYKKLFGFDFKGFVFYGQRQFLFTLVLALFFALFKYLPKSAKIEQRIFNDECTPKQLTLLWVVSIFVLIISVASITSSDFNPFIYFRF